MAAKYPSRRNRLVVSSELRIFSPREPTTVRAKGGRSERGCHPRTDVVPYEQGLFIVHKRTSELLSVLHQNPGHLEEDNEGPKRFKESYTDSHSQQEKHILWCVKHSAVDGSEKEPPLPIHPLKAPNLSAAQS